MVTKAYQYTFLSIFTPAILKQKRLKLLNNAFKKRWLPFGDDGLEYLTGYVSFSLSSGVASLLAEEVYKGQMLRLTKTGKY